MQIHFMDNLHYFSNLLCNFDKRYALHEFGQNVVFPIYVQYDMYFTYLFFQFNFHSL